MNKHEFDEIVEAVNQGVVASKEVDSNFWADVKIQLVSTNERLKEISEHLKNLNGKSIRNADEISSLKVWRGYITGGLAVLTIVVLPILYYIGTNLIEINHVIAAQEN